MAIKVLITGAAGQIAYSLIFMVARGNVFGPDQKIILHLFDLPQMATNLQGVSMEIEDCCFDLVEKVVTTSDSKEAFTDIDVALMVGAMPRRQGMERSDLLKANVKIFKSQGADLDKYAKKSVKVLVVGNPANTNAWIMSHYAPSIAKENFTALTRLDQNRSVGLLAKELGVSADKVHNAIIWGNHSTTQFPDVSNAVVSLIGGDKKVTEQLKNDTYLKNDFVSTIQKRGAEVISARGASSAVSAAKAICDHMHDWWFGTKPGHFVSMGVFSNGDYSAPKDVVFSFPVTITDKKWTIVQNLAMDDWAKKMIENTGKELVEERTIASISE